MYARVVIDAGATGSIDSLTYEIPEGLAGGIEIGDCVLVPLASRQAVGYVVGFEDRPAVAGVRPLMSRLDGSAKLAPDLLELARWISAQYVCPLPRVVATMLPGVMSCRVQATAQRRPEFEQVDGLTPSERSLIGRIPLPPDRITIDALAAGADRSPVVRVLKRLEERGAIRRAWQLMPPGGRPRVLRGVRVSESADEDAIRRLAPGQARAIRTVEELGRDVSLLELTKRFGVSASALSALRRKGLLSDADVVFRRAPDFVRIDERRVTLGADQQRAVDTVCAAIDARSYAGYLLFGVTASGKTEVYLRCVEHALAKGRSSLLLLPEIAITTQVMNTFKSRFGDKVAVMHSALSAGERFDEWMRVYAGEAAVVLGARSAVFAPLRNLGLVVVDEEHESGYKQDTAPRYNARDVAVERARREGAAVVLGSATPSVETFYRASQGEYGLLEMPSRVEKRPMPRVVVVDLRELPRDRPASIFSLELEDGIRQRLARREQVILLQNRRAYSTFLLCRECGYVARCPNCAVSLKLYSAAKKLSCHHCEHSEPAPTVCPGCGGLRIRRFGIGTERVEEETRKTFPEARVIRMDRDTTSRRGAHAAILNAFRLREADILVGTQMIAKGLDFPNVTLVGVVSADTSLNLPDFRASERTFQIVSQVAGRSGRGSEPGEVVVQTFDPDHYAIQSAVRHDYAGFVERELAERREVGWPPFVHLVNVISRDPDERAARSRLDRLAEVLMSDGNSSPAGVQLTGPMPAVLSKLRGEYRWHLVLRSPDRQVVLDLLRRGLANSGSLWRRLTVDVDPASML